MRPSSESPLFVGYTSGAVMQAIKQYAEEGEFDKDSNVIAIFPDHGSRYMSKVFSDDWMNEQGFFDSINAEDAQKVEIIKKISNFYQILFFSTLFLEVLCYFHLYRKIKDDIFP